MGGSARTRARTRALFLFPRGRLPAPPVLGTAPSQTVNPPVAEQPRGNRCGYAKYDVADHGLPSEGMRVDGQLVRQIKTCLRSWGRRLGSQNWSSFTTGRWRKRLRSRSVALPLIRSRRSDECPARESLSLARPVLLRYGRLPFGAQSVS